MSVWANRLRQFLKQQHRIRYYNKLTQCTLYPHLAEVEHPDQKLFDELVNEMANQEGIIKELKSADYFKWIKRMNNLHGKVNEIICCEPIEYQEDVKQF